jgi:hypothetical protein
MSYVKFSGDTIEDVKLRVMAWGGPGTGKSRFALSFPKPFVIDLENSTDHYREEFKFYYAKVNPMVKEIKNSTMLTDTILKMFEDGKMLKDIETLVIDPVTDLIDNLEKLSVNTYEKQLQGKLKGKTITELNALQKAQFYAFRKEKVRDILDRILKLPLNIVLLARDKNQWQRTSEGMAVTGKTYDGNDLLEYLPDFVINFYEYGKANIEKSRVEKLEKQIELTKYEELEKLIRKNKKVNNKIESKIVSLSKK